MEKSQQELGFSPKTGLSFASIAPYALGVVVIASIVIFFSNRALGEEEFEFSENVVKTQEDVTAANASLTLQEEKESEAYQAYLEAERLYNIEQDATRSQEEIVCNYVEISAKLMYSELEPEMTSEMQTLHDAAEDARECIPGYSAPSLF